MPERVPQSVAKRALLKLYLSSDHVSVATGKTLAVTISKNGAAFANPSAGATNATEIGSGWYYADLSTTDTATTGPLIVRGTATSCDDSELIYHVVNAFNGGLSALPSVVPDAAGGLPTTSYYTAVTTIDANVVTIAGQTATLDGSNLLNVNVNAMSADTITSSALATSAVTEIQSGLSTYAGGDTAGTSTLLTRLTSTRAGYFDNLSAGPVAIATQIPSQFTSATFASTGVFATAALANAPTGGSAPTVSQIRTEMDSNSTKLANLDATVSSRMATYTQPTGFLAATFPTTVASTTNITAGTVTTVTNLTNAPTAGDFTATMKTSITTAATAATPTVTAGTVSDKTGFSLASTGLDSIAVTAPTGVATTFPGMVVQTWRRFFKGASRSTTQIKTYADNGTTVVTTQAITDDGEGAETQGAAS